MKIDTVHIEHIRSSFATMQSREDFLNLLNYVKPLIYGKKAVSFKLKQLSYYSIPKLKFDNSHLQKAGPDELKKFGFSEAEAEAIFKKGEIEKSEKNSSGVAFKDFAVANKSDHRYAGFKIKKKSGSWRTIHAPKKGLKAIQKCLNLVLQVVYEDYQNEAATGFVPGKSITHNARLHEGANYVFNIDLKDFFPSIDQARVWKCLQLNPFNLIDIESTPEKESKPLITTGIRIFIAENGEKIYYKIEENTLTLIWDNAGKFEKYRERLTAHIPKPDVNPLSLASEDLKLINDYEALVNKIIIDDAKKYILTPENITLVKQLAQSRKKLANIIASLCCTEMEVERKNAAGEWEKVKKNVLPQGAPTSPVITNIVCQRLDFLLSGVAKRFGLKYSRYADDITFSSPHNVYQKDGDFLRELYRIITEQGFHINEAKTRLQKKGYRQEVTGLLVNDKVNVQKRYIKQIRLWLYYWERYGYERASTFFLQKYTSDKGHVKNGNPDMANVIAGKLEYLKMVRGVECELYRNLKGKFNLLIGKSLFDSVRFNHVEKVIDLLLDKGLDDAMDYFKPSNS